MRPPTRLAARLIVLAAGLAVGCQGTSCRRTPQKAETAQAAPAVAQELQAVVGAYRTIIVLLADEASLDAETRRRSETVARILFEENQHRLSSLTERLGADLEQPAAQSSPLVEAFLHALEADPELHDADKLAFRDVVDELLARLAEAGAAGRAPLEQRVKADQAAIVEIQALYEKELEKIFGRLETRGMTVRREAWEKYVAFLKARIDPQAVLKQYDDQLRAATSSSRGTGPGPETKAETFGKGLPMKSLVLTFDDGPHVRYTDRILETLKRFGVKAVFFEVGQNLGVPGKDGRTVSRRSAAASRRLLDAGFPLANHTFTHAFLPKLSDEQLASEIDLTNRMLTEVSHASTILFRPPYGARNEKVLQAVAARGMRSVLWNIDSKDWADPIPKSIANRVIQTVEGEKRGILLFHDIQARTVDALPDVLDTLQKRGYRFLAWNGSDFVDESRGVSLPAAEKPAGGPLYRESWAVVVGIDKYKTWPRLSYAVNDARGIQEILIRKYQFKPENVTLLTDEEATRERILSVLGDRLADPAKVAKDDRVFVFFAGHGVTRRLPNGRALGYLIPVEADLTNYQSQAVSMTNFQDVSEAIPAKHIFFVTDACYSGVALTRGGGSGAGLNYLQEVTRRTVRQVLTAGGADQEVADNGPNGHSIFTWALMQGLEGKADLSGDGYITATELASFVGPTVSSLSQQTPAFGNLVGSEGGEFVFELKHENEFLSELSAQLDEEAIRINTELEKVRARIAEKRSRNVQLQKELQAARGELASGGPSAKGAPAATAAEAPTAAEHNDRGMSLFREKRYAEALKEFQEAARLNPSNALAANNVGFTFYKLGRLDDAAQWFEKTLALDPRRAIAYANLGDACLSLGRKAEAKKAFETFLELQPGAKYATEVRKKLETLN